MAISSKYLILAIVLSLSLILYIKYIDRGDAAEPKPSYMLGKVGKGELRLSVSATGTLRPIKTVTVGSQVSGILEKVFVDFNDVVKKGDVVAQIDSSIFKEKVAQEEARYDTAIAEQEKAALAVEEAKRELQRAESLETSHNIAKEEIDKARFKHEQAKVEYGVKQLAIRLAKAELEQARVNLANTTIKAPIDGVILSRDVDNGQTVAASLQAPTLFTIALDLRHMQIETDVDEAFIGEIREGQQATFSVYAYPDKVFAGKLVQVRLSPKVVYDVVLYNGVIHVQNDDLLLKPGMTATVTIDVDKRENVLKVPNAALRYNPDMPLKALKQLRESINIGKNEALIWTLSDAGPQPVKVGLGLAADNETEISSSQVSEGQQIILSEKHEEAKRQTSISLF